MVAEKHVVDTGLDASPLADANNCPVHGVLTILAVRSLFERSLQFR